jgi:hypothetical protein
MAIKITVGGKAEEAEKEVSPVKVELQISKLLNNDYYISSHSLIDIIIQRQNKKILVLPKNVLTDQVYDIENRFFDFLGKHGVVDIATVQCGNIYGSLEGVILGDDAVLSEQASIFIIKKFLDEEKPLEELERDIERERELKLLLPDDDESTELGEVPHEKSKGTMPSSEMNYASEAYFFESKEKNGKLIK